MSRIRRWIIRKVVGEYGVIANCHFEFEPNDQVAVSAEEPYVFGNTFFGDWWVRDKALLFIKGKQ